MIFQRKISLKIMGFCFDWWILLLLTLKNTHYLRYMILRFVLTSHMYVYYRLAHLKKMLFSTVFIGSDKKDIKSLAKGQQIFKIKPVNIQSRSSRTLIKKEHMLIWNWAFTLNLTFIFIPTKQKQLFL